MPTDAAGELSGEGFAQARDYEQIRERVEASIPDPAEARPDVAVNNDVDTGGAVEGAVGVGDAEDADGGDVDADAVVGLSTSSLEVPGEDGYLYRAEGEYLRVMDVATGARAQEVNLYDCTGQGGRALCVVLDGDTLAVLFQTGEGIHRRSGDYALAAYGAPRAMVLFFDVAAPAHIVFDRVLGITGVPVAVTLDGDALIVAARHGVVPDIDGDGEWLLDGRSATDVRGYRAALELRVLDPYAFMPSFYDDGELIALAPGQIYLSGYGNCTVATTVAAFTLPERSCTSLFALYDPGPVLKGAGVRLQPDGLVLDYVADYQGAPARVSVSVPVGPGGMIAGIGQVSWSEM
jgi:hypothetical protein